MSDNLQLQGSPTHRRTAKTRPTGHGSPGNPNVKLVLKGDAYSHLDLAEVQDAIIQVEGLVSNGITEGRSVANRRASDSSDDHGSPPGSSSSASDSEPFRVVVTDETGTLKPKTVLALLKVILQNRLKVANRIVNDEWSIDGSQLLQAVQQAAQPPSVIGGLDDQLRNLPMEPTRMNIELVRIHLQLLSRFKASLDGNPDPESRFMKHWVPLSIKDPLLLQIVLYTATCFLNETGRVPKMLVWAYKGAVHKMLNEQLRSTKMQTSDAAIMGTTQMVIDSWYWGTTEELRAHMAGLKTMIKLRGGPQVLGMQGFLAKTVLMHDLVIALAHELEPTMYGHAGFDFRDEFMVPYQVSFNSPLLSDWPPFRASTLKIHPLSAEILDDMRAIIAAVLALPPKPTAEQLRRVKETAMWYFERLNQMPADVTVHEGRLGDDNMSGSGVHDAPSSSPAAYSDRSSPHNEPPPSVDTPPGQAFTDDSGSSPRSVGPPIDIMYRCIRATASIYYRAIIARVPTTEIVTIPEFLGLWEMVWEVTLSTWKTAVGIFVWVMLAAVPSCHHTPVARFIKTLMIAGFMTMGLENWHVAVDAAQAALRFQQWLREGDQEGTPMAEKGVVGGEKMIQEHGFALREALPEVAELRVDDDEPDSME
ncbi:hypothetical protein PT974_03272 [Cladobotryum mycophilum]|uniref:Uncharacterized protein n=1 Tax=Cladobotryum mycophilum TaxID=491253 RepID=A0ABR0SRU2_9HYPO